MTIDYLQTLYYFFPFASTFIKPPFEVLISQTNSVLLTRLCDSKCEFSEKRNKQVASKDDNQFWACVGNELFQVPEY